LWIGSGSRTLTNHWQSGVPLRPRRWRGRVFRFQKSRHSFKRTAPAQVPIVTATMNAGPCRMLPRWFIPEVSLAMTVPPERCWGGRWCAAQYYTALQKKIRRNAPTDTV
jgi:hypothetical protein